MPSVNKVFFEWLGLSLDKILLEGKVKIRSYFYKMIGGYYLTTDY